MAIKTIKTYFAGLWKELRYSMVMDHNTAYRFAIVQAIPVANSENDLEKYKGFIAYSENNGLSAQENVLDICGYRLLNPCNRPLLWIMYMKRLIIQAIDNRCFASQLEMGRKSSIGVTIAKFFATIILSLVEISLFLLNKTVDFAIQKVMAHHSVKRAQNPADSWIKKLLRNLASLLGFKQEAAAKDIALENLHAKKEEVPIVKVAVAPAIKEKLVSIEKQPTCSTQNLLQKLKPYPTWVPPQRVKLEVPCFTPIVATPTVESAQSVEELHFSIVGKIVGAIALVASAKLIAGYVGVISLHALYAAMMTKAFAVTATGTAATATLLNQRQSILESTTALGQNVLQTPERIYRWMRPGHTA